MDKENLDLKDHKELLKDLDNLEGKLQLLLDFYKELEILGENRKYLLETLQRKDQTEKQQQSTSLKKQVIFTKDSFFEGRRPSKLGQQMEKKKSLAQVYEVLESLTSYHHDVNKKISEIQPLNREKKSNLESSDTGNMLQKLQEEKDDIDDRIIKFVIKNVVEGKDELFSVITMLEDDNKAMEDTIILLDRRIHYLKDTVTALMLENQLLQQSRPSTLSDIKKEIMENVSMILPMSLRQSSSSDSSSQDILITYPFNPDDNISLERSSMDSFKLDAQLATWHTDDAGIQEQVKRIGKNLKAMEVNQMKLNLLKCHVQKHGTKFINRNTLIDPSKGMSLWSIK